jgi:hypothetical protein
MLGAKEEKGKATQSRSGIVRAATNFYRQLYDSKSQLSPNNPQKKEGEEEVPPIINREAEDAIAHLKTTELRETTASSTNVSNGERRN